MFKKFISISLAIYLWAFCLLVIFQRNFLYFPNDTYQTPATAGYTAFQEIGVTTEDGIALKGWYHPAKKGKKTIVFFHGNADSVQKMARVTAPYIEAGYGFLLTEYRGFSSFAGSPSETGLYQDARTFINALLSKGLHEDDLILWGHSMGTGVATQMAIEFSYAAGLMLLAPYTSLVDMAAVRFPFFPTSYVLWDRYRSDLKVPELTMPLLIVHGTADIVIPSWQGQALAKLAKGPTEFHLIPDGGHNDLFATPFAGISLKWLAQQETHKKGKKSKKKSGAGYQINAPQPSAFSILRRDKPLGQHSVC